MKNESSVPNFVKNEEEILSFWEKKGIFAKLKEQNKNSGKYYAFLDGPITANNNMGLHHALGRTLKDSMLKFEAMSGKEIHFQNGFDAQGLWIEVNVEKELGLKDKQDIINYGLDKFTTKCMERVNFFAGNIEKQSIRLGQMMDWGDSYFTNTDHNITSIWHFLKECDKRGWIQEKYRPMPWCARCGTSLSEHEMADEYKDVEHEAVFFKLPILNTDLDILVWTTTPWTLSANVALAVNPELNYAICSVKSSSRKLVVCESAVKVLKADIVKIEKIVKGESLVGKSYETCFDKFPEQDFEHKIVAWEEVDATEGSGVVHIAPGCGAEDFDLGQRIGLKPIIPVDELGHFYNNFGFLSGKSAFEVNDIVFDELKKQNKLYYTHKYKHRYPFCWRCKNPVIFRLIKEYVISVAEIRPLLIKLLDTIEWHPEFMKKRMQDWLTNMGDWSISRKRFYGLPLPFYKCEECGELTVVGSIDELKKLAVDKTAVDKLPHLHRPYVDNVEIVCPNCGKHVKRIPDVGDCWLDAGITPFSTKKYFTDKEFWKKNFPAECVIEGKEQIRLWFYSLLFMSATLTGKAPYKKVFAHPMLLAQDGQKLSKSNPNNIPLNDAFKLIGADTIRYLFAGTNINSDVRFGISVAEEIQRKLLGLWNVYFFFNTYASIDKPQLEGFVPDPKKMDITDKWLIEKTNNFVKNGVEYYKKRELYNVVKDFENYIDELSNWYIRVNRRRFWKSEDQEDKLNAYFSLYYAIKNVCKTMAPIIPFFADYIWQNVVREFEKNSSESVLLSRIGQIDFDIKTKNIIEDTEIARQIINLGARLRNENQIKVKQPLKNMYVTIDEKSKVLKEFGNIILNELNIKNVKIENDFNKFNDKYLTVNFKTAGAVLKGEVQNLRNMLMNASETDMKEYVKMYEEGSVNVGQYKNLDSTLFVLNYKPKSEFVIASENNISVVLDITIDEELMYEGLSRELIRQLQVERKNAGFNVDQRIVAEIIPATETMTIVLEKFGKKIMKEVLITKLEEVKNPKIEKTIEVAGEEVKIKIGF